MQKSVKVRYTNMRAKQLFHLSKGISYTADTHSLLKYLGHVCSNICQYFIDITPYFIIINLPLYHIVDLFFIIELLLAKILSVLESCIIIWVMLYPKNK